MTARERAELRGLVSLGTGMLRVGLFIVMVSLAGWVLSSLQALVVGASGGPAAFLWLVPTALFAAFLYVRAGRWTGGSDLRRKVRRDLERGEIAQHRLRVVNVLMAPEVEDEGPVFFVEEESGDTFFFAGQEMSRYENRGFPWREFEVAEAPESGRFFRLKPLGEPLADVKVRPPLTFEEAKALGVMSAPYGRLERCLTELGKDA